MICGNCGAVMLLRAAQLEEGRPWYPTLDKVPRWALVELRGRPDVKRLLDAFALVDFEARMARASEKPKEVGPGPVKIRSGTKLRLVGKGPDA